MEVEESGTPRANEVEVVVTGPRGARAAGWDDYVSRHPDGTGYHRLAWLESVAEAYGHRPWCLVALTPGGDLAGILPLCEFRIPFLGAHWISLPYCDLGGPLTSSQAAAMALQQSALDLVLRRGGKGLKLRLSGSRLDFGTETQQAKVSMLCPLPENSEALFKSYKPKLRSQIRKAEKNGLTAEVVHSEQAIDDFYAVFAANMHRLGSPVHSRAWFHTLQRNYGSQLMVGLVRSDQRIVGAGIVLLNGVRASIPWASTLSEYNHLAPNMLLYWTLLAHVTDQRCHVFDFGRSTPGEGTYRFKKQWGAEPHALDWLDLRPDGEPEALTSPPSARKQRVRALAEQGWQVLPATLAERLGPFFRKYISL